MGSNKLIGKFSDQQFQALRGQFQGGVKSLGKMSEQGFQKIKQGDGKDI